MRKRDELRSLALYNIGWDVQ